MEPVQLLLLGSLVSTLVFWCAALPKSRYRMPVKSIGMAVAAGAMNPCAYYIVLFEAYDRLPAQIAQPLNYTWAITLAILAWPILGQRLAARALLGMLFSYAGVVVLLTQGDLSTLPQVDGAGVALALGSTVVWAGYWLMLTRLGRIRRQFSTRGRTDAGQGPEVDPIGLMAWSFTFGSLFVGAFCLLGPGLPSLSVEVAAYGAWVGLIEMGITFLVWQHALRLTNNAGRIGQLIFLSPFISFAMIATVLGESIHATSLVGLAAIVAGLLIGARRESTGSAASSGAPRQSRRGSPPG